jgi:Tat protein translocase TatB subunit
VLNVGTPELLVIVVVALLVLGPTKLPDAMRQVGKAVGELRRLSSGFQAELRDAMQEPVESGPSVISPPATLPTTPLDSDDDTVPAAQNGDAAGPSQSGDAEPSSPA